MVTEPRRQFSVLQLSLDSIQQGTRVAEPCPVLVDASSWVPLRVPLRWMVRAERWDHAPNSRADALRALAVVYTWADHTPEVGDLDHFIETGGMLEGAQIESLIAFMRSRVATAELERRNRAGGKSAADEAPTYGTLGKIAMTAKRFLSWAADPQLRGARSVVPMNELIMYRQRLETLFLSAIRSRTRGKRIEPLDGTADEQLRDLISPMRTADGHTAMPFRFREVSPWPEPLRLRNWLIYQIARELGLRKGEILKIRIDDIITEHGETRIEVRRRVNDRADVRRQRPAVKRGERALPVSNLLKAGLRIYQTTPWPVGRRGVPTPYLFVASRKDADGRVRPLSLFSLHSALKRAGKHLDLPKLSAHTLRHTWAEEAAEGLLERHARDEERVIAILRELGGWSPESNIPAHYIRNVLRRAGNEYLKSRNSNLWTVEDDDLPFD